METTLDAERAAAALAALGAPVRLSILRQLVRAGAGGMTVGALQAHLGLPASTLSHHLRALATAGVLVQERQGRMLICRARYDVIEGLAAFLLSECCADAVAACPHPAQAAPAAPAREVLS